MDDNTVPSFSIEGSADLEDRVVGRLSAERADIRRNQETTPGIRAFLHSQQPRDHCHGHKKGQPDDFGTPSGAVETGWSDPCSTHLISLRRYLIYRIKPHAELDKVSFSTL